jgi:hypothetical protein
MNAAAFVATLNTVEQDHQLVLGKMQAMRQAVGLLFDPPGGDVRPALGRLRQLNAYFAVHFMDHLQEEEKTLFPLLEQCEPDGPDVVARLRREHVEIQERHEQFSTCLELADGLTGGPPRAVVRDLLWYGWDLWEVLDNHAHAETREVRRCMTRAVQGDTLHNTPGQRQHPAGAQPHTACAASG